MSRKVVRYISSDHVCVQADKICRFECLDVNDMFNTSRYEYGPSRVDIESNILLKIFDYCKERAKIILLHKDADDDNLIQQKLKDFESEFLKQNHTLLVDLVTAAIKLRVKTLVHMIFDDVADIFKKMTTKELNEIFKGFFLGESVKNDFGSHWVFKAV